LTTKALEDTLRGTFVVSDVDRDAKCCQASAWRTKAELGQDKYGDKTSMLGVLFGQGEVLLIVIMTAVVVYLVARRRKRKC
jgi:hypothetical protein